MDCISNIYQDIIDRLYAAREDRDEHPDWPPITNAYLEANQPPEEDYEYLEAT